MMCPTIHETFVEFSSKWFFIHIEIKTMSHINWKKVFYFFPNPNLPEILNVYNTFNIKEFLNFVDYISRATRQDTYIFIGVVKMT